MSEMESTPRGSGRGELENSVCALCNRAWWVFLIGGIASVAFGILAFVNPGAALLVLGLFLAAFLLVDGIANVIGAVTNRDKDGWWAIGLLGLASAAIGAYALVVPAVSMLAIVYMVSFMALLFGVSSLYLGWKIRREVTGEWVLYLTGVVSMLFSLLIIARPVTGTLSVVYFIASWAVLVGLLRIFFAFRVRRLGRAAGAASGTAA